MPSTCLFLFYFVFYPICLLLIVLFSSSPFFMSFFPLVYLPSFFLLDFDAFVSSVFLQFLFLFFFASSSSPFYSSLSSLLAILQFFSFLFCLFSLVHFFFLFSSILFSSLHSVHRPAWSLRSSSLLVSVPYLFWHRFSFLLSVFPVLVSTSLFFTCLYVVLKPG